MCAAQRNDIGVETSVSFEVLAQIAAAFDLVQIMEKRPRPECVKAPREMLQPHPITAKTDFKPGAIGFLEAAIIACAGGGISLDSFADMAFPFPFLTPVFASLGGECFVPIFCPSLEISPRRLPTARAFRCGRLEG